MFYFAYGSNMLTSRLEERVGKVTRISTGTLHDYDFVINKIGQDGTGKANLMKRIGAYTEGVIFDLSAEQFVLLDAFEAGYARREVPVTVRGEPTFAITYIAKNAFVKAGLTPSSSYLHYIVAGATEHNLSGQYRQHIAGL